MAKERVTRRQKDLSRLLRDHKKNRVDRMRQDYGNVKKVKKKA